MFSWVRRCAVPTTTAPPAAVQRLNKWTPLQRERTSQNKKRKHSPPPFSRVQKTLPETKNNQKYDHESDESETDESEDERDLEKLIKEVERLQARKSRSSKSKNQQKDSAQKEESMDVSEKETNENKQPKQEKKPQIKNKSNDKYNAEF